MHKSNVTQLLKQCLLAVILLTNVMVIAQPGGGPPPGRPPRGFKPPAGAKPPFDMNDPNQQQKKENRRSHIYRFGCIGKRWLD